VWVHSVTSSTSSLYTTSGPHLEEARISGEKLKQPIRRSADWHDQPHRLIVSHL
jgi:hypothetical protein